MLARNARLPLQQRLQAASFTKTALFSLRIGHNKQAISRFGFLVSKTVAKKAVGRNSIKRKMAGSIQQLIPKIKPGYDLLFVARVQAGASSRDVMTQTIETVLREQGVML